MPNEKQKRVRRTALQKELDSLNAMVAILKPLNTEQRARIYTSAMAMLPQDKGAE